MRVSIWAVDFIPANKDSKKLKSKGKEAARGDTKPK
jgi:hypothetical protein